MTYSEYLNQLDRQDNFDCFIESLLKGLDNLEQLEALEEVIYSDSHNFDNDEKRQIKDLINEIELELEEA
ncbi:hypothetical protein [Vibrio harveyi]|uniref:hypothetical protein n=1 Tax=Vibrio harveyi TaxID=669 RepID=UPI0018F208C3|nr:hypothetical protein [Vibrio harveyi]